MSVPGEWRWAAGAWRLPMVGWASRMTAVEAGGSGYCQLAGSREQAWRGPRPEPQGSTSEVTVSLGKDAGGPRVPRCGALLHLSFTCRSGGATCCCIFLPSFLPFFLSLSFFLSFFPSFLPSFLFFSLSLPLSFHKTCGILVPRPGIEPRPWQWMCGVLTPGPPGNSSTCCCK